MQHPFVLKPIVSSATWTKTSWYFILEPVLWRKVSARGLRLFQCEVILHRLRGHSPLLSAFLTMWISISSEDCLSFKGGPAVHPWVRKWVTVRDTLLGSCMKHGVGHEPGMYLVLYALSQERLENLGFLWSYDSVCQLTRSGLLAFPCNCCVRASHAEAARVMAEEETSEVIFQGVFLWGALLRSLCLLTGLCCCPLLNMESLK